MSPRITTRKQADSVINILLVDDHPLLRQGVAQLIEMEEGLRVIGEAGSGPEAIAKAHDLSPDMILLDLYMKGMSGIETLTEMRRQKIESRIVVFTVSDNQEDVSAALREGADGYLLKDSEPEDLLPAIRKAAMGEQVFSPQLTKVLAMALSERQQVKRDLKAALTNRELEILKLIAKGFTNKQIGSQLNITEATVKVHVKNLLKKLLLKSRLEAALWAVKHKVIV
ncbi:MAG: two-component system response regulator NarL [Pseudomonadales bacterium]|nr:two-component system response regulator NarL [Pseudomonadales bacterium]